MGYNQHGYIIRISENALIQMCLNGLEAYIVSHDGGNKVNNRLETFGLLWGHEISLPDRQTLYCVELLSIDTSAIRKPNSCEPNDISLKLKRDIMTSFWPQYDFLGDFHTHPYVNFTKVAKGKLYEFSQDDIKSIESYSNHWQNHNYRIGLVLTIALMKSRSSRKHKWIEPNTIEFTLGNYRLWLKGYITYLNDKKQLRLSNHTDENIVIDCPALVGLIGEYTEFGRGIKKIHELGKI